MDAKIKFLGGLANEITGSCYLLTISDAKTNTKILIDSGLIQGHFKDSLDKNKEILKNLKIGEIDSIVLTHSHIDHVGRLPFFVKNGFSGRIICSEMTASLIKPMLEDSAKIQLAEAFYLNRKNKKEEKKPELNKESLSRGNYDRKKQKIANLDKNFVEPLYDLKDVEKTQELIKNDGYEYYKWIRLAKKVSVKFYPSGHVMGGAILVFRISNKVKDYYLCFTGDLGRQDGIILPPPEFVLEPIDNLVIESTYGNRFHPSRDQEIEKMLRLLKDAFYQKKKIIIPSFAFERTQEIIYLLSYYMKVGVLPVFSIFLDSPLGDKITKVFAEAWEMGMFLDQNKLDFNPFDPKENPYLKIIGEQKSSDLLANSVGPYIVIAGSGMCDSGRVRGYLRANLSKKDTIVFLVGYMAENSLGALLKKSKIVHMNKQEIEVKAEIISFDSFSAHADLPFLLKYTSKTFRKKSEYLRRVCIVHGELAGAENLQRKLIEAFASKKIEVLIPKVNEEVLISKKK